MLTRYLNGPAARLVTALLIGAVFFVGLGLSYKTMGGPYPFWGRDFSAFWGAAHLFDQFGPLAPFDGQAMGALQNEVAGLSGTLYWHYPAPFLTLIYPFGTIAYGKALILFTWISTLLWIIALRLIKGHVLRFWSDLPYIAAPALWLCLAQGQNGLLIACLLAGGLYYLRGSSAWAAALFFGALVIKPHFGVLIPVILIAQNHWDVFWRTAVTSLAYLAVSTVIIGPEYWSAFFDNFGIVRAAIETGELAPQQISFVAWAQVLGLGGPIGATVQLVCAAIVICGVWVIWRSGAPRQLCEAGFLIGALLIPPYAFHYDLPLAVLALYLWRSALREKSNSQGLLFVMASLWALPFYHLWMAQTLGFAPAPFVLAISFVLIYLSAKDLSPSHATR